MEWATSNRLSDHVNKIEDFIRRYNAKDFRYMTQPLLSANIDAMVEESNFSKEELEELFRRSYGLKLDNLLRASINKVKNARFY